LAVACLLLTFACTPARAARRSDGPFGVHSMLYSNAPPGFKAAMFREASALGASSIRLDVSVPAIVRGTRGERDWSTLDEYIALARRYRIQVLGVALGTPWWMAACPAGTPALDSYKCPPSDVNTYGSYVGEIAAHARGVIEDWEILNEPDGRWAYLGTPGQYARELSAAAAAIQTANPHARVLIGGLMGLGSRPWLDAAFAAGGAEFTHAIDVANVHVRGPLAGLRRTIRKWRSFFANEGLHAPLWVTEHGYPSDSAYQYDPAFHTGEPAQAAYLARSLPALLDAGAARVFVTERDNLGGSFASEGLLGGTVADPPTSEPDVRLKPAGVTVFHLTQR
jgi:hypothetical protein